MVEKVEQLSKLEEEKEKISRLFLRRILFIVVCAALVIVVVGVSLTIGTADISFIEAYAAIFAEFFPDWFQVRELTETIVWQLRLPRILMGAMAGATLAMAGCTTQSILRNPLATPYTLGVSASAGFGAAIGFILAAGLLTGPLLIISNAFLFSLIPAGVVMIAARRMRASPETIILCGVAMAYIFTACNTLLQYFAEEEALRATVFWMVGDLARSAWWQLPYVLVVLTFLAIVGIWLSRDIGIIRMGDEDAKALGVEVERVRKVIIVIACLSTAAIVSFTGAIGFVGLLAPHISRIIIGGDERYLIPASGLLGAVLLLFADIIARTITAPVMLPVGAVTALLGGPMLIYLLLSRKRHLSL